MSAPARVLNFPVESPFERAMHSVTTAVEDIDAAIWQAGTADELDIIRAEIESVIKRLLVSSTVAKTRTEYPQ